MLEAEIGVMNFEHGKKAYKPENTVIQKLEKAREQITLTEPPE